MTGAEPAAPPASRASRAVRLLGVVASALLATSAAPMPAAAHDVGITSMARVFIDQVGENRYVLSVVDLGLPPLDEASLAGMLTGRCRLSRPPAELLAASARTVPIVPFECDGTPSVDDELTLPWDLSGVVVVFRSIDGTDTSAYVRGRGSTVTVRFGDLRAGTASRLQLAGRYSLLGAEHIVFGIDHLLFVLGLLLLVRGVGALVWTITAFTVAHSITLGAAVLGFVRVDLGAVEAAIALSIVLLAREIVVGARGGTSLVHERPWLVAFGFGLLHGFGFAGALGEIGLRSADVTFALFSFNVGVEAGQLAFVAAVLALDALSRGRLHARRGRLQPLPGYALGAVATLWFFDRLPGLWGV